LLNIAEMFIHHHSKRLEENSEQARRYNGRKNYLQTCCKFTELKRIFRTLEYHLKPFDTSQLAAAAPRSGGHR
jgi:hypothetical protein